VYEAVTSRQVVLRNNRWFLDNGNCRDSRQIVYFAGSEPTTAAPCKVNEVDVPNVVGSRRSQAEAHLLSMPLTPEIVWRPAEPGEQLGIVSDQMPRRGTLSSWSTVRIVLPEAKGRVPDVVGLTLERARRKLAGRHLAGRLQAYADGGRAGTVLAQFQRAGRAAVRNMTIRLVVARG
jgi:beta-lactam-binding protein with PASTA domain